MRRDMRRGARAGPFDKLRARFPHAAGAYRDLVGRRYDRSRREGDRTGLTARLGQQVIVDNRPTGIIPGEIVIKAAPDLPTVAEAGLPGYQSGTNAGMFAPVRTPARLIALLNQEIVQALNRQGVKELLFRDGTEVVGSAPQDFAASMKAEIASMGKVIKAAGIRTE
jgi:hypothetical protein